ncbi:MAG: barstar family protein [Candidatus Dechloromonas phosphoritropha]|jgi:RNAse (barnase) inhibitor barstar
MSEKFLGKADQAAVYYLPASRRNAIDATAGKLDLRSMPVDLSRAASAGEALRRLGEALNFPDWYGVNFDALVDCLTDPECLPGKGHVLFVDGAATLRQGDPRAFATLLEVLRAAAGERRAAGAPLWILLDTHAPGIHSLPEK